MGMFDYYRPAREQRCPVCSRTLEEWQGKDAANALFVWAEGSRSPVDQLVDDDLRLPGDERERLVLPTRFTIYSFDCPDHYPIEAECQTHDGTWNETVVQSFDGC